jgi:hypothetical protein
MCSRIKIRSLSEVSSFEVGFREREKMSLGVSREEAQAKCPITNKSVIDDFCMLMCYKPCWGGQFDVSDIEKADWYLKFKEQ